LIEQFHRDSLPVENLKSNQAKAANLQENLKGEETCLLNRVQDDRAESGQGTAGQDREEAV
jgi:hypothetical protein